MLGGILLNLILIWLNFLCDVWSKENKLILVCSVFLLLTLLDELICNYRKYGSIRFSDSIIGEFDDCTGSFSFGGYFLGKRLDGKDVCVLNLMIKI